MMMIEIHLYLLDCGLAPVDNHYHIPCTPLFITVEACFLLRVWDSNLHLDFPSEGLITNLADLNTAAYELFEWLEYYGPGETA